MTLCRSRGEFLISVQFVQSVPIVQNLLNGLNALNVLNGACEPSYHSTDTYICEIRAKLVMHQEEDEYGCFFGNW